MNADYGDIFSDTEWTTIYIAGNGPEGAQAQGLNSLAASYLRPLEALARRMGVAFADAQDRAQEVLISVLHPEKLARLNRSKGMFRSYLSKSLQHAIFADWRKEARQKRDVRKTESLDAPGYDQHGDEPVLEQLDVSRARYCLEETRLRLRSDAADLGRFDLLWSCLVGSTTETQQSLAQKCAISPEAFRQQLFRLRREVKESFLGMIKGGVYDPSDLDEEFRYLLRLAVCSPSDDPHDGHTPG
jgi:RNA polymerase sigma factor (sigma-70 family)